MSSSDRSRSRLTASRIVGVTSRLASRPICLNSKQHHRKILSYACSSWPAVAARMSRPALVALSSSSSSSSSPGFGAGAGRVREAVRSTRQSACMRAALSIAAKKVVPRGTSREAIASFSEGDRVNRERNADMID